MTTTPDATPRRDLLSPLLFAAALLLCVVPWLHPNNTCKDWLERWGQLAADPMWLPIHQVATAGFALGGFGGLLLALLSPPSRAGLAGGASLAAGYGIQSMLVLIHASAVSSLGSAFNAAAGDEARRQAIRVSADAWVAYDVASSCVAAWLISAGAVLMVWALYRSGVFSWPVAVVMAGLGAIWGLAYYRHIPGEWVPYSSLALWLAGIGLFLVLDRRRRAAAGAP
jgi:hypothetical protein